jgi:hypothetical protein
LGEDSGCDSRDPHTSLDVASKRGKRDCGCCHLSGVSFLVLLADESYGRFGVRDRRGMGWLGWYRMPPELGG